MHSLLLGQEPVVVQPTEAKDAAVQNKAFRQQELSKETIP